MANINGELHYYPREEESYAWQHRKLGERVEIKEEEIAEIAKAFRITINVSIKERKKPAFREVSVFMTSDCYCLSMKDILC